METTLTCDSRSILDLIGNTPLVRLRRLEREVPGVELYAKAEWHNPGGSVKDRAAARMLGDGEESGQLTPDKAILDATSGNTGIAYAMVAAAKGYRVRLCVPANIARARRQILEAYGAELIMTDPLAGSDGAIREARRLYAEAPDGYFYVDQYNNESNWRAHYDGTGPEIVSQTDGRITHFVAGLGTSGTFMGTGRRLREFAACQGRSVTLISVQPLSPMHGLEGLKHMPSAMVPGIYDPGQADRNIGVSTEEAYVMVRRLATEQGILVGISSGAAAAAAMQIARSLTEGVVVTIFCDAGERYLAERFWKVPMAELLGAARTADPT